MDLAVDTPSERKYLAISESPSWTAATTQEASHKLEELEQYRLPRRRQDGKPEQGLSQGPQRARDTALTATRHAGGGGGLPLRHQQRQWWGLRNQVREEGR